MNGNSNAVPDWKFRTGQDPKAPHHPCRSDRWARRAQVMWGVIGILNCRDDDCSRETIGAWRYGATASSGGELRAFTEKTESRGFPAGTNRIQGLCWSRGQHGWRNRIRRICVGALLVRGKMALPSRKLR